MSATTEPMRFGNFVEQRSPGIGPLGLLGTGVLILGGAFAFLVFMLSGFTGGVIAGTIWLLAVTITLPPAQWLFRRIWFSVQRAKGEHQWRSGVFSRNAKPECRLPGMLGGMTLIERSDAFGAHGETFVVVKSPRNTGLYTIIAKCVADGPWMQDPGHVQAWVSGYAGVLAALGHENACIAAKAITDTAPDPGGRLAQTVWDARSPEAPPVAISVIDEVVASAPATSSENTTYVELTFAGRLLNRKGDEERILSALARMVPGIRGRLVEAGGGAVSMMGADELAALVRVSYDPASAPFLEQAALAGHVSPVPWNEAGPVAYQESWDELLHDSGRSVTWEMLEAPRSAINERSLTSLLAPSSDFARKRVALVYRPHTPAEAAHVSESDVDAAIFNADQGKKRIRASSRLRVRATERSRDEVAMGAGMVRFSMLITATVLSDERGDLDQAIATIESNVAAVLMRVRRSRGSQAAAFAATLPVGFVPWEHTVIPDRIREKL